MSNGTILALLLAVFLTIVAAWAGYHAGYAHGVQAADTCVTSLSC